MSAAVVVEGLSKRYRIGQKSSNEKGGLIGSMLDVVKAPINNFRKIKSLTKFNEAEDDPTVFWALKDLNFEVQQGEILGIIGHNGAGKSTLLKILSRITFPTNGRIEMNGRLASLLEVGTGFHPEFTGRQNVFMNGSILGMSRQEIERHFDEIIAFSGVEKHIDTPVKFYSSGMKVRLGFAVAAHLNPEILIVDEVLAVGDAAFQRKCLGKMNDVSQSGKTILFVSHSMQAVRSLCKTALVLKAGQIMYHGHVENGIKTYETSLHNISFGADALVKDEKMRRGRGLARFSGIEFAHPITGEETERFDVDEPVRIKIDVQVMEPCQGLYFSLALRSPASGELTLATRKFCLTENTLEPGQALHFEVLMEDHRIRPNQYGIYYWLGDKHMNAMDVVDGMTPPLLINTELTDLQLGYDPANAAGGISTLPMKIISLK